MNRLARQAGRLGFAVGQLRDFEPGRGARIAVMLATGALTLLLALVGIATEARFTFSLLLLVPTMVAAWYLGRRVGFLVAALAVTTWFGTDLVVSGDLRAIDPWVNLCVRAIVFGLVVAVFAGLREALRELNTLAHHDALTGLANRRLFAATIASECERAARFGHPVAVASIDLDGFKALNDRRGHAAGDAVLVEVGRWLTQDLRVVDCAARMGGDEFAVLLPECDPEAAHSWVVRVRSAWERRAPYRDHAVGVSMGIVTFVPPLPPAEAMLSVADAEMYQAKRDAKGSTRERVVAGS
ncbi:MAG: GGDEF domain-containing protein [Betaproteobacteria bacterium]